jgi:antitoxin component YwqK of YwqJK toxin-antitoxin module
MINLKDIKSKLRLILISLIVFFGVDYEFELGFVDGLISLVNQGSPQDGAFISYYENEKIEMTGVYKDGKRDELWEFYDEEGNKKEEGSYRENIKEGQWTTYYTERSGGRKKTEENYKRGKKDGHWTYYREDGTKLEEVTYKEGQMDGPFVEYHLNGNKKIEGINRNNQIFNAIYFHQNGDKINGLQTIEDDRNSMMEIGSFIDGKKDGEFNYYHFQREMFSGSSRKVIKKEIWKSGQLVERIDCQRNPVECGE